MCTHSYMYRKIYWKTLDSSVRQISTWIILMLLKVSDDIRFEWLLVCIWMMLSFLFKHFLVSASKILIKIILKYEWKYFSFMISFHKLYKKLNCRNLIYVLYMDDGMVFIFKFSRVCTPKILIWIVFWYENKKNFHLFIISF